MKPVLDPLPPEWSFAKDGSPRSQSHWIICGGQVLGSVIAYSQPGWAECVITDAEGHAITNAAGDDYVREKFYGVVDFAVCNCGDRPRGIGTAHFPDCPVDIARQQQLARPDRIIIDDPRASEGETPP